MNIEWLSWLDSEEEGKGGGPKSRGGISLKKKKNKQKKNKNQKQSEITLQVLTVCYTDSVVKKEKRKNVFYSYFKKRKEKKKPFFLFSFLITPCQPAKTVNTLVFTLYFSEKSHFHSWLTSPYLLLQSPPQDDHPVFTLSSL